MTTKNSYHPVAYILVKFCQTLPGYFLILTYFIIKKN